MGVSSNELSRASLRQTLALDTSFSSKLQSNLSRIFSIAVIALSFLIVAYFLFWQFDDKPAILEFQPSTLLVKNEAGNLLWKKEIGTEPITFLSQPIIKKTKSRIVDLKNDGRKEIVTVHELDRGDSLGGLSVFDENGNQLWYSVFSDSVQTKVEKFSSSFTIRSIVDIYNNDEILVIAQHYRYYPSPFIRISSDGKIISGDFWHPGGSMGGFLEDIDDDGKIELVASAISNGLERCVIFSIEYDKLIGTAPTSENYSFLGMQIADFDHYVVLPRTDYNRYFDYRYNTVYPPYINEKKRIGVSLDEDRKSIYLGQAPLVVFNKDFSNPEVVIADDFRSLRDSIVVAGKLNPPLTDTPEYAKILEDQIRYWNGEEFVTHDEYFKK